MCGMWRQIYIIGCILPIYYLLSPPQLCNFGYNLFSVNLLIQFHQTLSEFPSSFIKQKCPRKKM